MKRLTFIDLCSGIGGFRLGLEAAGHKCIGYCEYDKFARASYEAMYDTERSGKQMTLQNLSRGISHTQTSGHSASHARTSPSQENREGCVESEVESITVSLTSSKAKKKVINPHTFLLRTLKTCFQSMEASILPPFSLKWTKRGMTQDGRCLTPKISESPKTGSGCSLSQILEAEVGERFYLSREKTEKLLKKL